MNRRMSWRRSLLSFALLSLVGAAAQARDETTIAVKTRGGTIERVDAGDVSTLQPGEIRALSTRGGSAATITRTADGLLLAIAGDQYPIALPEFDATKALDGHGHGHDGTAHETHKVVLVKRHGAHDDAHEGDDELAALGLPDLDDDEALLAAGDGPKVFVRRTKQLEEAVVD